MALNWLLSSLTSASLELPFSWIACLYWEEMEAATPWPTLFEGCEEPDGTLILSSPIKLGLEESFSLELLAVSLSLWTVDMSFIKSFSSKVEL